MRGNFHQGMAEFVTTRPVRRVRFEARHPWDEDSSYVPVPWREVRSCPIDADEDGDANKNGDSHEDSKSLVQLDQRRAALLGRGEWERVS